MANAKFADGTPQPLYFPEGGENAGAFKGMARILEEQGFVGVDRLGAECPGFKCQPGAERCCC
jgi:hypothetical protein